MEAKSTDERAPIAGVDVQPARGRKSFFAIEEAAVFPIDVQREHLPSRVRKAVKVFDQWAWRGKMYPALWIAPGYPQHFRPVGISSVNLP